MWLDRKSADSKEVKEYADTAKELFNQWAKPKDAEAKKEAQKKLWSECFFGTKPHAAPDGGNERPRHEQKKEANKKNKKGKDTRPAIHRVLDKKLFSHSISTDGVGASVHMERRNNPGAGTEGTGPKKGPSTGKRKRNATQPTDPPPPPPVVTGRYVVGVDPGQDGFTAVAWGDRRGCHKVKTLSTKDYRRRAGFLAAAGWQKEYKAQHAALRDWEAAIPQHTCHIPSYERRLEYIGRRLDEILDFYMLPRLSEDGRVLSSWRIKRWHTTINQLRTLAKMAWDLVSPGGRRPKSRDEVIVAWGNKSIGWGSCISRQGGGAPNKKLRKAVALRAQLWEVDEDCTSKICSHCAWGVHNLTKEQCQLQKGTAAHPLPDCWRVRQHVGCGCARPGAGRTVWNRDVNAARHILFLLLLASCLCVERPLVLCRRRRGGGPPQPTPLKVCRVYC